MASRVQQNRRDVSPRVGRQVRQDARRASPGLGVQSLLPDPRDALTWNQDRASPQARPLDLAKVELYAGFIPAIIQRSNSRPKPATNYSPDRPARPPREERPYRLNP